MSVLCLLPVCGQCSMFVLTCLLGMCSVCQCLTKGAKMPGLSFEGPERTGS